MRTLFPLLLTWLLLDVAGAANVPVAPGTSLQAAIDAASPGDVLLVPAGTWSGDVDFHGRAVTVRGTGPDTVLRGTGTTSVVRFASGEGPDSVLDALTITGGSATYGGGIHVDGASPTILRTVVRDNAAVLAGSGIWLSQSSALVANNLLVGNHTAGGDPHTLQILNGAPRIVNNTITEGDSNGILVSGAAALIANNIIAHNGSRTPDGARGRGICDFSGGASQIRYNLFFRNVVAALLAGGEDWRRVERAQRELGYPSLVDNQDGSPGFLDARRDDYRLRRNSRARHAGDPDPQLADRDGSRNTQGYTGGPLAQ